MNSTRYRERLIDEVKKHPVLYDTRHEQHRDIDVRDRCWHDISERLGANSEVLKREWKILRDSMRQALKRSKEGATTKAGEPCKKWRFQSRMAFILPYVTVRRREARQQATTDAAEEPSDGEGAGAGAGGEVAGDEHDATDLFFASVCQSSKRLPRRLRAALQRRVLDALLRAEDEMEADSKDGLNDTFTDAV